jgi:hypothetical protein
VNQRNQTDWRACFAKTRTAAQFDGFNAGTTMQSARRCGRCEDARSNKNRIANFGDPACIDYGLARAAGDGVADHNKAVGGEDFGGYAALNEIRRYGDCALCDVVLVAGEIEPNFVADAVN